MNQSSMEHSKLAADASQFQKFLPLLWELIKRDFKAKYKRSNLGVLWTILQPLATMAVMTVVFSTLFNRSIDNFPIYLMSGMMIYGYYTEATNMSMRSLVGGKILFNARMPVYMIPLSRVLSSLINTLMSLTALSVVMIATGVRPTLTMLLIPFPLIYTTLFSFGIGMLLACGMVFFKDLAHLYGIFLTLLHYITPIFYPDSIYPERFRYIFHANPLYHFVTMSRNIILYGVAPSLQDHIVCLTYGVVVVALGLLVLYRNANKVVLEL